MINTPFLLQLALQQAGLENPIEVLASDGQVIDFLSSPRTVRQRLPPGFSAHGSRTSKKSTVVAISRLNRPLDIFLTSQA